MCSRFSNEHQTYIIPRSLMKIKHLHKIGESDHQLCLYGGVCQMKKKRKENILESNSTKNNWELMCKNGGTMPYDIIKIKSQQQPIRWHAIYATYFSFTHDILSVVLWELAWYEITGNKNKTTVTNFRFWCYVKMKRETKNNNTHTHTLTTGRYTLHDTTTFNVEENQSPYAIRWLRT